ncbi:glycosyltransferase [Salipiger bermudensis]|uniref:glycosyltransferase n=1 Tax=Salipiger bermudensis TaxID=344736 RepID=UPI00300B9FED
MLQIKNKIYRRGSGYTLNIDSLSSTRIVGWAKRNDSDQPLVCTFHIDGKEVATAVPCDLHRDDLAAEGIGQGNYGFDIPLPSPLSAQKEHVVTLVDASSGKPVGKQRLRSKSYRGNIDAIHGETLHGWCTKDGEPAPARIDLCADKTVLAGEVLADQPRPDVQAAFGGRAECGYAIPLPLAELSQDAVLIVRDSRSGEVISRAQLAQLLAHRVPEAAPAPETPVAMQLDPARMAPQDAGAAALFTHHADGVELHGFAVPRERRVVVYAVSPTPRPAEQLPSLRVMVGPREYTLSFPALDAAASLHRAELPCLFGAGTAQVGFECGTVRLHTCELPLDSPVLGNVDGCDQGVLRGWAVDFRTPGKPAQLCLGFNGVPYDQRPANIPRPDIQKMFPSFPQAGFRCGYDPATLPHDPLMPYVEHLDGGFRLKNRSEPLANSLTASSGTPQRLFTTAPVTVIVPVYNAVEDVEACIDSLLRHTAFAEDGHHLLLANDASPDERIHPLLDQAAAHPGVTVLHQPENLGYTRNINAAMRQAAGRDTVLLNSDTRVTPQWLSLLQRAALQRPSIGTVTAVSDNAGAFSVPERNAANPTPPWLSEDEYARAITHSSTMQHLRLPTGSGFCMYVSDRMVRDIGLFDEETFPRGYGEENDFCMRGLQAGWEHVLAENVLIYHERSKSFLGDKTALMDTANELIPQMYPEYGKAVGLAFAASPAMKAMRHRIARTRLRDQGIARPRVAYVIGVESGGTPQTNMDLMSSVQDDYEPFLLLCSTATLRLFRITGRTREEVETIALSPAVEPISHDSPAYRDAVADLLQRYAFELVHIRHIGRHGLSLISTAKTLEIPVLFSLHDFYTVCPNVKLLDAENRYCGGRCTEGGADCNVELWRPETAPTLKHAWIKSWQTRFRKVLGECDGLITTSPTARDLIRGHYGLEDVPFEVIPHARDFPIMDRLGRPPRDHEPLRIFVPGHLVPAKGLDLIRELKALDTEDELEFHFAGVSREDLSPYGISHGRYERDQLNELIRRISPHLGAIFSIWPETYSHTVTEMWAAGLPVVAGALGATGERIGRHGGGWALEDMSAEAVMAHLRHLARSPDEIRARCAEVDSWQDGYGHHYSLGIMAERYKHIYRRTLAGRASAATPAEVMVIRRGPRQAGASAGTDHLASLLEPILGPLHASVWPDSTLHVLEHVTPPEALVIRYHGPSHPRERIDDAPEALKGLRLFLEIAPDCPPSAWQADTRDPELHWLLQRAEQVIAPAGLSGAAHAALDISPAFADAAALEAHLERQKAREAAAPPPLPRPALTPDDAHARRLDAEMMPGSSAFVARHNAPLVAAQFTLIDWRAMLTRQRVPGRVSIVVPIYNKVAITEQLVRSVLGITNDTVDYEIILLDNGSQNEVRRQLQPLERLDPRIRLVRTDMPLMFSVGCNYGASFATGEFILFLNNDMIVHSPNWLDLLTAPLHEDPGIGIVGSRLLYEDMTVQHAGIAFNALSRFPYHIYKGQPGGAAHVMRDRRMTAVTGACMMMRASDWAKLRGFSPIYVNGSEDIDICLRMSRVLGLKIHYAFGPQILHLEGKSPGRGQHNILNRLAFLGLWKEAVSADDAAIYAEDQTAMPAFRANDQTLNPDYRSLEI